MSDPRATNLYRKSDEAKLAELHPHLADVVYQCAKLGTKFIVVETIRGKAAQELAKHTGHSNARFGQSPHNYNPALGVDLGPVPYPGQIHDYQNLALAMFAAAKAVVVAIDWGGDWHSLKDYPHFELSNWKVLARSEHLAT